MREKISIEEQVKKLHGLQTIESISDTNKISKKSAINLVSKLKKKGYVAYYSAGRNKRIYSISPIKPKFKESLYEFINKYSKIKVSEPYRTILHGEKMSPEKAMILALKSQNFRLILASLNLFKHIKNWKHLNELAKKEQLQRQIGALYDLSREIIKVRKIDKRINNSLLNGKGKKYIYSNIKTREYFNIAKKWRVEIPFNKKDIERLKIG